MIIKKLYFILTICLFSYISKGQEFDFDIKVSVPNNVQSDPQIFSVLENEIREFFNRTKWTSDDYNDEEKIKGSIQLTITEEPKLGNFVGDIIVQTTRPVYQSNYETTLLNTVDKSMSFSFIQGQPIQRSDNQYYDNLSSTLTFYAYVILGYDYDSFSSLGGDPFFDRAREVMNALPATIQTNDIGWKSGVNVGRNKYWVVTNQLDPRIRVFRNVYYEYHRLNLDRMADDPDKYRAFMLSNLRTLNNVVKSYPNSMSLQMFADAKREEIINIFVDAPSDQKSKIYDLMTAIEPFQSSKYSVLR